MAKIGFVSLGCSKNQVDTEVMLALLDKAGYEITSEEIDADVIIINTCAFIESAKKEAIDNILDIAWLKEHRKLKKIIVTGCLAERYREQILAQLPEVDAVVGVGSIYDICSAVDRALKGERCVIAADKNECRLGGDRMVITPTHSAYIKIAEGCDNKCTYCAIPLIRGRFRSRPIEDIVQEAKLFDSDGTKELSLIAQDTTRYGIDLYGEYSLVKLIRAICKSTSIPHIRLLYCYPDKITDELVQEIKTNPRVLKYIDLPIQHINDRVLTAMNRHGKSAVIKDAIKRLREQVPDIVIRTTVIVGFPGETQEEFDELLQFVKDTEFERLGAFTYSREEDTLAYDLDGQIDEDIKDERLDSVMTLQAEIAQRYNEKQVGRVLDVLVDEYDAACGAYVGRSFADAPDVDCCVFFDVDGDKTKYKQGDYVKVRITDFEGYDLIGESVKEGAK